MAGHILQRTQEAGNAFELSRKQQKEAISSLRRAADVINGYEAKSKFVHEVMVPLQDSGLLNKFPNFSDTVDKRVNAYLGIPDVLDNVLQRKLESGLVSAGVDPKLVSNLVRGSMSTISKIFLYFHPRFWLTQIGQWLNHPSVMLMVKARGELFGEKVGDINKASIDSMKDMADIPFMFKSGAKVNPILKYAMDHGHTDPVWIEAATPGIIKDPVAVGADTMGRAGSFINAYHYYKQLMSHEEALKAAGKLADMVNVSYHAKFGRPTALGQLQYLESPVSLFMTFPQHMFGMMNQQLVMMAKMRDSPKAALRSLESFAGIQATALALYGIGGIAFVSNTDAVIRTINSLFSTNIKTSKEVARDLDALLPEKLQGVTAVGLFSKAVGYDVSASGQGPNVQMPDIFFKNLLAVTQVLMLAGRGLGYKYGATDRPVTAEETWSVAKHLPSRLAAISEFAIKDFQWNDTPDNPNATYTTSPMKDILVDSGIQRTERDKWVRLLTGLRSLNEQAFSDSMFIDSSHEMALKLLVDDVIQSAKEHKYPTEKDKKNIMKLSSELGKDPGTIIESIIKAYEEKPLTPEQGAALKGSGGSAEAALRYKRLQEIRSKEPKNVQQ
jgi:hypothetical protein